MTNINTSDRTMDKGCAETPMSDRVATFWRLLKTETVRISVDCYQHGEHGFWNGLSTFPDDVAKAIVANRAAPAGSDMTRAADPRDEIAFDDAGCDFALVQLCKVLGVDLESFSWDAATETFDGDVQAVIGNILRSKYGEDFDPRAAAPPAAP